MISKSFPLDQLATPVTIPIDLSRHQFLLVREGGKDPKAWKKALDKVRTLAQKLPIDAAFDSVKEVRAYRNGTVD